METKRKTCQTSLRKYREVFFFQIQTEVFFILDEADFFFFPDNMLLRWAATMLSTASIQVKDLCLWGTLTAAWGFYLDVKW